MSVALQFKLTQTGQAAVWNANNTGTSLNLTHIQFGSGNRAPSGTETALLTPQQAVAIAAGFSVSTTQIRMSAIFGGNQNYVVREVGLWAGDPAVVGSKLVGYWSQATGDLAMKSPGVDFIFSHDMTLDAVPAGSLTILADNAQSAMLAMITAHEAAANPHTQYATKAAVQAQTYTAFTTAGVAPTFTLTASPAIAAYAAGQRLRVKFGSAGNGADTLNVNALGSKSLKQYDATGAKVAAVIAANQLVDVEYDGVEFVLLDPLPVAVMPLSALQLPVIDNATGMMPVTITAVAGNGGTVSLAAGTAFTLGMEVVAGVSAFTQNSASPAWTSPALVANAEYFLRAQFVSGVLTFYVQLGALADAEPASRKGTVNGAAGGGFFSTTLDICLARIVTGAAGTTPTLQKVINRRSSRWNVTLNGTGTVYMPIDPFTKNARIVAGNATPHATLVTYIYHGSGGWTGANYSYISPNMPTGSLSGSIYWAAGNVVIIGSNTIVGDMFVSTSAATFDHSSARSIWQVFQTEHQQGDTSTSSTSDELLLGTGTKTMRQADYDNGLAVSYANAVNSQLSWEIMQ